MVTVGDTYLSIRPVGGDGNFEDVCAMFDLYLHEDTVLGTPPTRTNVVDVPGMDGALDLSDVLTGDVQYGNRVDEIVLHSYRITSAAQRVEFERLCSDLRNLLHGRLMEYRVSLDPKYVRKGRFEFDGADFPLVRFSVTAEPYKRGVHHRYVVKGAGGSYQTVENGRRHVIPTITVQTPTIVAYEGKTWELGRDGEVGAFLIDGLRLKEGSSAIYVNSAPDYCDTTIQDLEDMYGTMDKCADMIIAEMFVHKTDPPEGAEYDVVIEYDEYDL